MVIDKIKDVVNFSNVFFYWLYIIQFKEINNIKPQMHIDS